ncbi:MAG TPA: glutathione S-transferase family protein [Myxococcota bacterium]|nr:glutathione S-transferase family protein [Myxococcota bacterium]
MLTLYHAPRSRSTRILWLLEELETAYEIRYVDIKRPTGGARDPSNPHPDGKVPALLHDGRLVTESVAIALYLTDAFPARGIGPTIADARRAEYLTWLAYYAGVMEPMLIERAQKPAEAEQVDRRIDATLAKGPYLLGEKFSAADILLASIMQFSRSLLPASTRLDAFLARVSARPALGRALKRDSP